MDDMQNITHKLEYLFLRRIVVGLRDKSISIADAKKFAKEFRLMEPFASLDDVKTKLNEYTTKYSGFSQLVEYANAYHSEQKLGIVIDKMRKYIKNDQIDEAIQTAKSHK